MISLSKAIQYAGKFVGRDTARPIFNYVLLKGGEVVGCDTRSVIRCKVNGVHEPRLISIKGAEIVSEPANYPDVGKFFRVQESISTHVVFTGDNTSIKERFKKLAVIFDTCKKLTPKKEMHNVCLRTKGDELLIFSGEDGELVFFEHSVSDVEGEPINCFFNADYLSKVCKVIAEAAPYKVTMHFFTNRTVLIQAGSIEFFICGIFSNGTDWLSQRVKKYSEAEKVIEEDSDLSFLD